MNIHFRIDILFIRVKSRNLKFIKKNKHNLKFLFLYGTPFLRYKNKDIGQCFA